MLETEFYNFRSQNRVLTPGLVLHRCLPGEHTYKTIFIFPHGATEKRPVANISELNLADLGYFIQYGKLRIKANTSLWADYIILDLKKPWFIVSQGCHWVREKCFENKKRQSH